MSDMEIARRLAAVERKLDAIMLRTAPEVPTPCYKCAHSPDYTQLPCPFSVTTHARCGAFEFRPGLIIYGMV